MGVLLSVKNRVKCVSTCATGLYCVHRKMTPTGSKVPLSNDDGNIQFFVRYKLVPINAFPSVGSQTETGMTGSLSNFFAE